jgi:hypothetical protein
MCRYAWHHYRDHFACFDCRKAFKHWQWEPCDERKFRKQQKLKHVPRRIVCPECSQPMVDMGLDFKAPAKSNVEAWQVLKALAENGVTFHGCGCFVGFKPPRRLREVPEWLESYRQKSSAAEQLLNRFNRRVKS